MVSPPAPDPVVRFVARRQLARSMFERPAVVLGPGWPAVLASLRLATAAHHVVLVGPVASALRGHPGLLDDPRVGVIGAWRHQGAVLAELMDAGAMMMGFDTAPDGFASRELWADSQGGRISVGWLLAGRDEELDALRATCDPIEVPGGGTLLLPTAEALRSRAARSAWPRDRELVPGFDAVLAAEAPQDARPAGRIELDLTAITTDRSLRPEHVALTFPFTGDLPARLTRPIAAALKRLAVRDGDPRSLRGITLKARPLRLLVSAAGTRDQVDDWLASGDLNAAVAQAVDDAYDEAEHPPTRSTR